MIHKNFCITTPYRHTFLPKFILFAQFHWDLNSTIFIFLQSQRHWYSTRHMNIVLTRLIFPQFFAILHFQNYVRTCDCHRILSHIFFRHRSNSANSSYLYSSRSTLLAYSAHAVKRTGGEKSASKSFYFPLWEESSQNRKKHKIDSTSTKKKKKRNGTTIRSKCLKEVLSKWIHISLRKCAHMYFTSEFTGVLPLVLSIPFDEKEIKHTHHKKDATIKLL